MSRVKEIEEFIASFMSEEECGFVDLKLNKVAVTDLGYDCGEDEDLYKDDEFINSGLDAIATLVKAKYDIDLHVSCVGGFESPGYDIDCYAWAAVVDGDLLFGDTYRESY